MINRLCDDLNLMPIHMALCYVGAFLCLAVMQMSSHQDELIGDSKLLQLARRVSTWALGLGLLWAASFSDEKGWQPWAPDVFVIFTLDCVLFFRAITIYLRWKKVRDHSLGIRILSRRH